MIADVSRVLCCLYKCNSQPHFSLSPSPHFLLAAFSPAFLLSSPPLPPFLLLFGTPSPLRYVPTTLLPCFVTYLAASVKLTYGRQVFLRREDITRRAVKLKKQAKISSWIY